MGNATIGTVGRIAFPLISFNVLFAATFAMQLVSAAQTLS